MTTDTVENEMRQKPPFPYFGGKSAIAKVVWEYLGDVPHYIEPFFGSGAVFLNRPPTHRKELETVNDKDGFVANVWRSIQFSPEETARWCDWPVNHADLSARKNALIKNEHRLLENLIADEKWHDPVMAGYWIWAASCWIGSGLTKPNQRPHIGDTGKGVHALGKIPHISNTGQGVHALGRIQCLGNEHIYAWFRALSERLRHVRVVCGDWDRVCGGKWQTSIGTVGIFFDPPYGADGRHENIYHIDSMSVAADVKSWCKTRGENRDYRIIIAGYDEYEDLLECGWTSKKWKAHGGYSCLGLKGENKNRFRETLYISPHCLKTELF